MQPGQVWLADLDKRRPVVIVRAVPWLHELHIVPVTSVIRGLPSEIDIPGLPLASVANAQRLTLVPRGILVRHITTLPTGVFDDVHAAVCGWLAC